MVREIGDPMDRPAPCYIKCRCGAKPRTDWKNEVLCECGTIYSGDGWIVGRVTQDDRAVQAAFDGGN